MIKYVYLGATMFAGIFNESILVHNPISFSAFGRFSNVKNQSFLDTDFPTIGGDNFVGSGGFPIPRTSNSIGSWSIWILPVSRTKKVPLFFTEYSFTCKIKNDIKLVNGWTNFDQKNTKEKKSCVFFVLFWITYLVNPMDQICINRFRQWFAEKNDALQLSCIGIALEVLHLLDRIETQAVSSVELMGLSLVHPW